MYMHATFTIRLGKLLTFLKKLWSHSQRVSASNMERNLRIGKIHSNMRCKVVFLLCYQIWQHAHWYWIYYIYIKTSVTIFLVDFVFSCFILISSVIMTIYLENGASHFKLRLQLISSGSGMFIRGLYHDRSQWYTMTRTISSVE